jgi:hypothetical protein
VESELTRAQELADALASERAQAEKLAPLHRSVAARNQAQVKLFATYPSRVTNDHSVQLGGELRREREMALALDRARVRVQELALAQAESQARAQAVEERVVQRAGGVEAGRGTSWLLTGVVALTGSFKERRPRRRSRRRRGR